MKIDLVPMCRVRSHDRTPAVGSRLTYYHDGEIRYGTVVAYNHPYFHVNRDGWFRHFWRRFTQPT
jgi:hypothetical protein